MKSVALALTVICALGSVRADEKPMMNAVVAHEYGQPDVLRYEKVPVPEIKPDEMLVRVMASGVNPADPLIVSGKYAQEFGTHLPLIPGYDVAGTVERTGAQVTRFHRGDAVYGYALFGGGWAEYAVLSDSEAAAKPKTFSFIDAASVPLAALTAWQALIDAAQLQPGQTVLIQGGSGGVGHFGIQIAKARGARVIATASTRNQDLLRQLGADVAVDYTTTKFEDVAHDVDVVLDTVGGDTLARSCRCVKKGGFIASIRGRVSPETLEKYSIRAAAIAVKPDARELAEISKLIEAKKLQPVVTEVLPLADGAQAAAKAETHHTRGKIVLKVAGEQPDT